MGNVRYLLKRYGIHLAYDVIKKKVSVLRKGEALEECDLLSVANLNGLGAFCFLDFITTLARRNPFNPVAEWIEGTPWDGVDRLKSLYATVQVHEDYPPAARDFLIYRWLLSCVAAALEPSGFKARGVLVLQGEQGLGKTSWIARLVPPPMNAEWIKLDHHLDAHNKDSIFGAVTHWMVEIGELDSSFRKDIARTKGFLTNSVDKLRLPYARSPVELDRRTVFAGTVNEWNFLIDPTGNSRFWTMSVTKLDYRHDIHMQQVFAQLAVDYRNGEQWWLNEQEERLLESLNRRHEAVSVIEERLTEQVSDSPEFAHRYTALQMLEQLGYKHPSNAQCREMGGILRKLYGPPKRNQGRDKWLVPLKPIESVWQRRPDEDKY